MKIKSLVSIGLVVLANLSQAESGPYVGLVPSLVLGNVNLTSKHAGFTLQDDTRHTTSSALSTSMGVLFGYVYELPFGGAVGLEADFLYANQTVFLNCQCTTNPNVSDRFSFRNQMQGSLRGRFGYKFLSGRLLPFVTVGGTLAAIDLDYANENADNYAARAALPGWLVGGGVEWRFTPVFSLRGEHHHSSYNSLNLAIPTIYGLTDTSGAASASSCTNTFRLAFTLWL